LIYICIPTHNEQQTVGVVLWKLRQVLTEFHRDYQLLVADDASTDRTTDVLEPYTRVLPLTVIRSEAQQGYAASLEMLLREAVRRSEYPRRDVIVTLQADFSEEPDDVVGLIKRMEAGADVAVGIKVSSARETRLRRFARSLSSFFTRSQPWPEGVVTPFDGYRAYRLHAVKRAIEERGGRRLLHYDGWAGHAELLRAVLPHARRVDTLNVEDRPDRLQRPRRERPFAAAWQVRAMASGAEPRDVVSVEELDRIAATASRSRERAVLNGSARPGRQDGRDRKRPQETRADSRGRGDRSRSARPDRSERSERPERGARPDAQRQERGRARPVGATEPRAEERVPDRQRSDASRRTRDQAGRDEGRTRKRAAEPAADAAGLPDELVEGLAAAGGAAGGLENATGTGGTAPKKRRRRRRSRSGAAGGAAAAADAAAEPGPGGGEAAPSEASRAAMEELDELFNGLDAPARPRGADPAGDLIDGAGDATDDAVEGEDAPEGGAAPGERKRRRRGGTRRGGRGRRRRSGTGADAVAETSEGSGETTGEAGHTAATGHGPAEATHPQPVADRAEPDVPDAPAARPVADVPVADRSVAEKPAAERPAMDTPEAGAPVAERPVAQEPASERPATADPPAGPERHEQDREGSG
jgi:hypothetical protein